MTVERNVWALPVLFLSGCTNPPAIEMEGGVRADTPVADIAADRASPEESQGPAAPFACGMNQMEISVQFPGVPLTTRCVALEGDGVMLVRAFRLTYCEPRLVSVTTTGVADWYVTLDAPPDRFNRVGEAQFGISVHGAYGSATCGDRPENCEWVARGQMPRFEVSQTGSVGSVVDFSLIDPLWLPREPTAANEQLVIQHLRVRANLLYGPVIDETSSRVDAGALCD